MRKADEEHDEVFGNLKRVQCISCHKSEMLDQYGLDSNAEQWHFEGYDDEVELHRCPFCEILRQSYG